MTRIAPLCLVLAILAAPALQAQDSHPTENPDAAAYIQPPAAIAEALATDKNYAVLNNVSPDGRHFLVPHQNELSTLDLMSRETYRLGELELRPATDRLWHLDTYGIDGIQLFSMESQTLSTVDLPDGTFASDFMWSPDGAQLAFLAHLPGRTEVWSVNTATGKARSWSNRRVLATIATSARGQGTRPSSMLQWTPSGGLITLVVSSTRGGEPYDNPVPSAPVVRRTRDEGVSTRTYPNLLEDSHDEDLFEHYTVSQMVEVGPRGRVRDIGTPAMWESISLSPDGRHILATRIERPFSYRTSFRGFPRRTVILDSGTGAEVELDYSPLREGGGGGGGGNGPRGFNWIPDGSGLAFLERAERNKDDPDAVRPDRVMRATAPFDLAAATEVASSDDPLRSAVFSEDGTKLFATVSQDGKTGIAYWDLQMDGADRRIIQPFHGTADPLELPGTLLTKHDHNGIDHAVVATNGVSVYVQGAGYQADFKPRPFIDRVALTDGATERVFEGAQDSFDRPQVALDADLGQLIVQRESKSDFPNSYLVQGDTWTQLTTNQDPFPAVTAAQRMDFEFERRDGLKVQGRVSLPVGYRAGEKVPAIFWTYPREYTTTERYERAAIRGRNQNAFTHMSWLRWSDLWLTQGYALVYPDIPIIGENYNDTYIGNLVDAMYGAIRAVDALDVIDIDRIGHGGHSYGAFATANILANAPFFKAGIAGDGAYNRSLTPSGFQAERRTIWEAPHTYIEMSPFFKADQIDTPMLMYHGGDDNNTGTFPIQSRRMIHALTEHGKTAVLYEYPYESHTPRAIENKLDMWGRFIGWFDTYVKGPAPEAEAVSDDS
jgi:dipeptidyl aminopeptidase/acylaminoacyl peptidase